MNQKRERAGQMQFGTDHALVQSILDIIKSDGYDIDDRLPPERILAKVLGVSRNTLRGALRILQTLGLLEIRRGSGTFVRRVDFFPDDNMKLWLRTHRSEISDMLTVREALELKAVELIPERMYMEIRGQLKRNVALQEQAKDDATRLLHLDMTFHNIIRKNSGNELLLNICKNITELGIFDERKALFQNQQRAEVSINEHLLIANAFSSMDVNQIKMACIAHFTSTRLYVLNVTAE
jgi:GntR family transcriptional repressor for pyruvate dehydrogenase complex